MMKSQNQKSYEILNQMNKYNQTTRIFCLVMYLFIFILRNTTLGNLNIQELESAI
jgi:hypothetical protein